MAATHTIRVTHLGGIKVGYAISGNDTKGSLDPRKPTCVLINALHTTVAFWRPQFESQKLTSAANLLAIEPLGHGATVCSAEYFTYWDTAIMALQVMDKLGIERAFAMGTSQGGFIVARMALMAPHRVSYQASPIICSGHGSHGSSSCNLGHRFKALYPLVHRWTTNQKTHEGKDLGTLMRSAHHTWSVGLAPSLPRTLSSTRIGAGTFQHWRLVMVVRLMLCNFGSILGGNCTGVMKVAKRPGWRSCAWSREMAFSRDCQM